MFKTVLFSLTVSLASTSLFARPDSIEVTIESSDFQPTTMQWREQTTRDWLPACKWPDFLQGTGWFPATFYYDFEATEIDDQMYVFDFEPRSGFSKYCDGKTDNVANYVGLVFKDLDSGEEIYGGIPLTVGQSSNTSVEVFCEIIEDPEFGPQISCDNADLADAETLQILVKTN